MSYSIIIPSRTPDNLFACVKAIRSNQVRARIIVIWDQPDETEPVYDLIAEFDPRVEFHLGVKPFIFSRAINMGIRAAEEDAVILLNDDAQLQTRGGFDLLEAGAVSHPEYGVVSALIEGMAAANEQVWTPERAKAGRDRPGAATVRCSHHMLAFMAVYIRRDVLNAVGEFDERFVGYGYEDDDYCKRATMMDLDLAVEYSCVVEHGELPSTFRGLVPAGMDLLAQNRELFREKWIRIEGKP